ncbi:MAG: DUF5011 domain-containing protein [Bacilli bacterium]|nr:DUF5011 domain-containing protein [Bacilli bacterium]
MEEEKFWTKTRIIIIAVIVAIIAIVILSIFIHRSSMTKKYRVLESQINNAAPNYISNEEIELTEENEYRKIPISALKNKYVFNSNMDDCDGYVIAKNINNNVSYKTYIKCKKLYVTDGYGSTETGIENKTVTQTENDTKAPEIKLLGADPMTVAKDSEFVDPGATATDNVDKNITKNIKVEGTVDTSKLGEYKLVYSVSDKAGNTATKERKVVVIEGEVENKDVNPPVITFTNPNSFQKICLGQKPDLSANGVYGYTSYDDIDGNITAGVVVTDKGNINKVGTYTIDYSSKDSSGNITTASRTYSIVDCTPAPQPTPQPQPTPNPGGNSGGGNNGGSSSSGSSGGTTRPEVNITVNVTSISSVDSLTLYVGQTASLNASVLPSNATNKTLTYKSNNAGIASVDGNGNVRGVSRGETRIIITSNNNIQKAVYIVVK